MSLKSYKDPTKGLFVMVQQQSDDKSVTLSYMANITQEVAAILPILPLLLEGRLGMKVSRYFRSSYSIGTEGYKWDEKLDKFIPTGIDNYLEEIDRHWIQHTYDYDTRNKHCREEDHGEYAINVVSFDISGALDKPRLVITNDGSIKELWGYKHYRGFNSGHKLNRSIHVHRGFTS